MRRIQTALIVAAVVSAGGLLAAGSRLPSPPSRLQSIAPAPVAALQTDAQIETFLLKARVVKTRGAKNGVTGTLRATLSDGTVTHDAQIQTIDEEKSRFETVGGVEFNFRDSWKYNVAGYRLDRLIGLGMVPVSVSRRSGSQPAAFTWWIDDVMMEEGDRLKKQLVAPDVDLWNQQMRLVRVFDQLIYNVDRNLGNLLITKDWRIWAIDHTRAFRRYHDLQLAANLTACDRQVLERMKALDRPTLDRAMKDVLTNYEIEGVLARRDAIVKLLESKGPSALFDRAVPGAAVARDNR